MSNLPNTYLYAYDSDGTPLSGALLYTYEAGTTTPLATYPTEADALALTNANTNPVVADSAGKFGAIWLKPNTGYKLLLKESDGTTVSTFDNAYGTELSSGTAATRIKQIAASPLDYPEAGVDAVGDGAADESSQVQNAIDASSGVVDLLGLTFRCDSALDIGTSGLTIRNGTLDFTQCADNAYLAATGSLGASNALTGNSARGDLVIDVTDGSGFAADDWFLISSDATWDGTYKHGELCQVHSVSVNAITLKSPIEGTYNTADSAYVKKVTPVSGLRLEGVTVLMATGAAGTGYGLDMLYCEDVAVSGCHFNGAKAACIRARMSVDVQFENCIFEETAAAGVGVLLTFCAQRVSVVDCTARRTAAGVSVSIGNCPSRYIRVSRCMFDGVVQGVVTATTSQYVTVDNCTIICDTSGGAGTGDGIEIAGIDTALLGNSIREAGGNGIAVDPSGVTFTTGQPWLLRIDGNMVRDCDDDGIAVGNATGAAITNNQIVSAGSDGVTLTACVQARIVGNDINTPAAHGINFATSLMRCVVSGNNIIDAGGSAISSASITVSALSITGNNIEDPAVCGITLGNNIAKLTISGNTIHDIASGAGLHTILLTGSAAQVTISGNVLEKDGDTDDNVQLAGSGAAAIIGILFSGNYFSNGDYGIGEPTDANNTNIAVIGNIFEGMGSGATEGTISLAVAANDHNASI